MMASLCIIVLGMHRSGTSALTGVLRILGAETGSNLLQPSKKYNPKGFWEHSKIVSIHDDLLRSLSSSWHDTRALPQEWWHHENVAVFRDKIITVLRNDFSNKDFWIIKDPRISRLLPLWLSILSELECKPRFVICVRHPVEVARSLYERNRISTDRACMLWLQYTLGAELWTRGHMRSVVDYSSLLLDWKSVATDLSRKLELPLDIGAITKQEIIEKYLEPRLRHHKYTNNYKNNHLSQIAIDCYKAILECNLNNHSESILNNFFVETSNFECIINPWECEIQELSTLLLLSMNKEQDLSKELDHLTTKLNKIEHHPIIGRILAMWRHLINQHI